jgi:hypothetical protein
MRTIGQPNGPDTLSKNQESVMAKKLEGQATPVAQEHPWVTHSFKVYPPDRVLGLIRVRGIVDKMRVQRLNGGRNITCPLPVLQDLEKKGLIRAVESAEVEGKSVPVGWVLAQ